MSVWYASHLFSREALLGFQLIDEAFGQRSTGIIRLSYFFQHSFHFIAGEEVRRPQRIGQIGHALMPRCQLLMGMKTDGNDALPLGDTVITGRHVVRHIALDDAARPR